MTKLSILKDVNKIHSERVRNRDKLPTASLFSDESNIPNEVLPYTYRFKIRVGYDEASKSGIYRWVVGWIDDDKLSESLSNTYSKIQDSMGSMMTDANKIFSLFGRSAISKFFHRTVWTDSEPPSITLNVRFVAENSAFQEVMIPARMLQMVSVPADVAKDPGGGGGGGGTDPFNKSITLLQNLLNAVGSSGGFVGPPSGYSIFTEFNAGSAASLEEIHIGNFYVLNSVLPESIDVEWDMGNVDKDGIPISANVRIELSSYTIWTTNTIFGLMAESGELRNINSGIGKDYTSRHTDIIGKTSLGDIPSKISDAIKKFFDTTGQ